jgi:hypothetical protein
MVSLLFALQRAENIMKNANDEADYIINWINIIVIVQQVTNPRHSHSMVAGGLLEMS